MPGEDQVADTPAVKPNPEEEEARIVAVLGKVLPAVLTEFQKKLIPEFEKLAVNVSSTYVNNSLEAIGTKIAGETKSEIAEMKGVLNQVADGLQQSRAGTGAGQGDMFSGIMNLLKLFGGTQNPMGQFGQPDAKTAALTALKTELELAAEIRKLHDDDRRVVRAEIWQDIKGIVQTGGEPFKNLESPVKANLNSPGVDRAAEVERISKTIK